MDRMTIVYINGFEEKYQVQNYNPVDTSLFMLHFKQLIENDMLKLIINNEHLELIPLTQIRKIIIHPSTTYTLSEKEISGFLAVSIEKNTFNPCND